MGKQGGRPGRRNNRGSSRGGQQASTNNANTTKTYKKKTINDCVCYLGSATQASDYRVTTEIIINHVKKTFDQGKWTALALKQLERPNIEAQQPTLKVAELKDEDGKDKDENAINIENRQFEIQFKSDYGDYKKIITAYDNNLIKACALLWERCAKGMQNKIEARTDFTTDIEDNPLNLLKAIKEHALNYQEHRYEMSIILDSMRSLFSTKQKEKESLSDFSKRFRTARDVMASHVGGPLIFDKYAKSITGYDDKDVKTVEKCQQQAFDKFLGFLYLVNSDQKKYGSLPSVLNTNKSLGDDKHPDNIADGANILSNHPHDNAKENGKAGRASANSNNNNNTNSDGQSNNNNNSKADPKEDEELPVMSFAQMEGNCYCCGKSGHMSNKCKFNSRPKDQWAINKAHIETSHANVQVDQEEDDDDNSTQQSTAKKNTVALSAVVWCSAHINMKFY